MIDIRGAPGSQNGFDNSGRRGAIHWHDDETGENVNRLKAVLQTIIDDFVNNEYSDTVTAIQLLNEPAGFIGQKMVDTAKQYHRDGYAQVRSSKKAENDTAAADTLVV
jgi:glucan 1,3-beta-glucosidase